MKPLKHLAGVILLVLLTLAQARVQGQAIETHTFTTNRVVPDGNAAGLSDVRNVNSSITLISSVKVRLKVASEYGGDLYGYVRHSSGFAVLLNRPGKSVANPVGYADHGFDITFQTGAPNGDIHAYQTITTPSPGTPLTGTWEPDGRTADPSGVTDASPRSTSLTNLNGLNATGEWVLYLADLESGGTNMLTEWALEITGQAYPTVTWPQPADIVYGTALGGAQLNATATYASTNVAGTFSYTPAAGSVLGAGTGQTLSVLFTPADTAAFLPLTTNVSITVLPAPLTLTVDNKSKVYGESLPQLTASYAGFVLGQGTNVLTSLATLSTTATSSSNAGTYVITASGAAGANYAVSVVDGILLITPALTTGLVVASANPAAPGATVIFTATVSAVAPGSGTPAGSILFRVDGTLASTAVLSAGAATFTTSSLPHGSHTVVAEFAGNLNFVGTTNSLAQDEVINASPIAGADAIERYPTQGVKVRLATLLANDSDADGDALVINVGPASTNGGTVQVIGGWVFYAPVPGFTNVDAFTYTITDGHGGSTQGTVSVALKVDLGPGENLTITDLGNGSYRIDGNGIPGRAYRLQGADPLSPATWQDLSGGAVIADAAGRFDHTDTPVGGQRLYRSVHP